MGRWIIWPDTRFLKAHEIIQYAKDAISNGEAYDKDFDGSLESACALLEDCGHFTFCAPNVVPQKTTLDNLRNYNE